MHELCSHPSYARHKLSVQASKLAALVELGELAFQQPLIVTQGGFIVDGYARWELAKRKGVSMLPCFKYDINEHRALRWLIQTHRRSDGLTDFVRIELALDLEEDFKPRASLNRQEGGRLKGLSKLTGAEKVNSRAEIARVAHVSVGNVHKVKYVLAHACSLLQEAARSGEVSINRAERWSHESEVEQQECLRIFRIERGIRKKARHLVAAAVVSPSRADEPTISLSDFLALVNQLNARASGETEEYGSVQVRLLNRPGRAIFVTEELIRSLTSRQEVLIR